MELSMFEIALLVWCFIATSMWLDAKREASTAKAFLFHIIENPEARERMVEIHKDVKRQLRGHDATQ